MQNLTAVLDEEGGAGRDGEVSFVRRTWGSVKTAILASSAVVMFGLVILAVSLMAAATPGKVSPHEEATPGGEVKQVKVEYYLPYPGMLPDNVLYKVKAARDRVVWWLTRDEEKKARKELLYADKRINAAVFLTEGGKEDLGVSTATKAEKYLEAAAMRAIKLSKGGRDVKALLLTLETATSKHIEILDDLQARATGGRKKTVEEAAKQTRMVHERVEQALREAK